MKTLFIALIGFLSFTQAALAQVTKITNASIIELSSHKIDRLINLKKIDGTFRTKIERIEVSLISNQPPYVYRSLISQTKPLQGNPIQLEILFDKDGNALTYKVLPNGVPGVDKNWPGKDALELSENPMHYVLANSTNPQINPFFTDASSLTLIRGTLAGQDVAQGQLTSYKTKSTLNIYIKLDGTFISYEIMP